MRRPLVAVALAAAFGLATASPASAPAAQPAAFVRPVVDLAEPPPPPRPEAPAAAPVRIPEPPPPPSPPPAPVVSAPAPSSPEKASGGSCGGWEALIAEHFGPAQVAKGCAVIGCETGGTYDPGIHNQSSSASGLWQFLDSTWERTTGLPPPAAAYSAEQQTAAAAQLWRTSGWSPWACA